MVQTPAPFPVARPRRNRRTDWLRDLTRENELSVNDLIWPVFVRDGDDVVEPINSMPSVNRLSVSRVVEAANDAANLGIPVIAVFPYTDPSLKTPGAEEAWNPENLVNRATRAIKEQVPDIGVMLDVALDPYNSCLLYTSPSPRDRTRSRMPSSA